MEVKSRYGQPYVKNPQLRTSAFYPLYPQISSVKKSSAFYHLQHPQIRTLPMANIVVVMADIVKRYRPSLVCRKSAYTGLTVQATPHSLFQLSTIRLRFNVLSIDFVRVTNCYMIYV